MTVKSRGRYPDAPRDDAPREEHKAYAERKKLFWLPCHRCGKMFGGHEWAGTIYFRFDTDHTPLSGMGACCGPDPILAARNPEAAWIQLETQETVDRVCAELTTRGDTALAKAFREHHDDLRRRTMT